MARLDQALVEQGLAESRARAQAMIAAGVVRVDGAVVRKASRAVSDGMKLAVDGDPNPFVSRGGLKLAHGLAAFEVDPAGCVVLDLGASTGGFSDVVLQGGAARVFAVDVGHGQLHPRIAGDPRCVNLERQDVRRLTQGMVPPPDLIVGDLAFISLAKALPTAMALAKRGARMVVLVKPQFELEPGRIGKGGIVRDADAREEALAAVVRFVTGAGWEVIGTVDSPVAGGDGNREYLLGARKPG